MIISLLEILSQRKKLPVDNKNNGYKFVSITNFTEYCENFLHLHTIHLWKKTKP